MVTKRFFWSRALFAALLGLGVGAAATALAQPAAQPNHSQPHASGSSDATSLASEIRKLRSQVGRLEDALRRSSPKGGMSSGMSGPGGGMMGKNMMKMDGTAGGGGGGMMGGGMMDMMKMGAKAGAGMSGGMADNGMADNGMADNGMADNGMADNGMADDGMEMMGMGRMESKGMAGMSRMKAAAALPGFPGASHIYHIGATGFFLDHPEHITLTTDQQTKLNEIKRKTLLEKATAQRKIEEAEQQLWELTGADHPDIEQIQAKLEEIEDLRGKQRLAFIRAVGGAVQLLTTEQRKALLGTVEPAPHSADSHPATK